MGKMRYIGSRDGLVLSEGLYRLASVDKLIRDYRWPTDNSLWNLIPNVADGDVSLYTTHGQIDAEAYTFLDGHLTTTPTDIGSATPDERMCVLRYPNGLDIDAGVTLTPQTRKKGLAIFVEGDCNIYGKISMTARGAKAVGQQIHLYGAYEVPAIGAAGGAGANAPNGSGQYGTWGGTDGGQTANGACGGGGGGSVARVNGSGQFIAGAGSEATSYSGGTGGGAMSNYSWGTNGTVYTGYSGGAYGGAGGTYWSNWLSAAGGGSGNDGGLGRVVSNTGAEIRTAYGGNGTGGLIILFVTGNLTIGSTGSIESKGTDAARNIDASGYQAAGGGASGGGAVNIFHGGSIANAGIVTAAGGLGGYFTNTSYPAYGGSGGQGTQRIVQI